MEPAENELASWVRDVLVAKFDVESASVRPEARLREDLNLESLDLVDLVLEIERRIGRRIENQDVSDVRTVEDVVRLLRRLGAAG